MPSGGRAEVVDLDRVRVLELRDRADLALEARLDLRVARQVRVQRLDGDLALGRAELLLALVDRAHAALAEEADDLVLAAQDLADHRVAAPAASLACEHGSAAGAEALSRPRPGSDTWGIAWLGRPNRRTIRGAAAFPWPLDGRARAKDQLPGRRRRPRRGTAPRAAPRRPRQRPAAARRAVPRARGACRAASPGRRRRCASAACVANDGGAVRLRTAPSSGKSKRTRSMSVGPSKSSTAKRPITRGVACGAGELERVDAEEPDVAAVPAQVEHPLRPLDERRRVGRRLGDRDVGQPRRGSARVERAAHVDDAPRLVRERGDRGRRAHANAMRRRIRRARTSGNLPRRGVAAKGGPQGRELRPGRATRASDGASRPSPGTTTRAAWSAMRPGSSTRPVGERDARRARRTRDRRGAARRRARRGRGSGACAR